MTDTEQQREAPEEPVPTEAVGPNAAASEGDFDATEDTPEPPACPEGWSAVWSAEHSAFYFSNDATLDTQWDVPTEPAPATLAGEPAATGVEDPALRSAAEALPADGDQPASSAGVHEPHTDGKNAPPSASVDVPTPDCAAGPSPPAETGSPISAAGAEPRPPEDALPTGWQSRVDEASGVPYYFCTATQQTQWTRPKRPAIPPGWCYSDASGAVVGPYTREQLAAWRAHLPMDLMVWSSDPEEAAGGSTSLAQVLGDGALLLSFQAARPGQPAPPAGFWEMKTAGHVAGGSTASDYASAVLAGLPEEDDSRRLHLMAAEAGQTLTDVVRWQTDADAGGPSSEAAYATKAHRDPRTGRITAGDAPKAGLYDAMARWCDPSQVDEHMARSAASRQKPLPREVWTKLKDRRVAVKRKAAWTRDTGGNVD